MFWPSVVLYITSDLGKYSVESTFLIISVRLFIIPESPQIPSPHYSHTNLHSYQPRNLNLRDGEGDLLSLLT